MNSAWADSSQVGANPGGEHQHRNDDDDNVLPVHLIAQFIETNAQHGDITPDQVATMAAQLSRLNADFARFRLYYEFGIEAILTKVNILRREFEETHAHSPIEHVRSRLKSPRSLVQKVLRYQCEPTIPAVRERVRDIAGVRIVCSFISDVYWIASMLSQQPDVHVVETKDYIKNPKPNGYRSLHLIVQVPVFLSDRTENVFVELQIRTIAMDFWASVEHDLSYKYEHQLPQRLVSELDDAATTAAELDRRMEALRAEVRSLPE